MYVNDKYQIENRWQSMPKKIIILKHYAFIFLFCVKREPEFCWPVWGNKGLKLKVLFNLIGYIVYTYWFYIYFTFIFIHAHNSFMWRQK